MQTATTALEDQSNTDGVKHTIAVLVPCYNEELTIAKVVQAFQAALSHADIYVYDNNSLDKTFQIARAAGAIVRREGLQGKGNVVRRMFSDVEADIYLLVDGDATYHASSAQLLVYTLVNEQLDMVVGRRVSESSEGAYRQGHRFGNTLLTSTVSWLFGVGFEDMLSGYRVFSRRFVKSFPAMTRGFEIETELTIHALELRMPFTEVPTPYSSRPPGSTSKLRTYHDGIKILLRIGQFLKNERPLLFFGVAGSVLATASLGIAYPILQTYFETGLVPRFPTAILSTGIMLLAFLSFGCGIILDTVTYGRKEAKRLAYLSFPAVGSKKAD